MYCNFSFDNIQINRYISSTDWKIYEQEYFQRVLGTPTPPPPPCIAIAIFMIWGTFLLTCWESCYVDCRVVVHCTLTGHPVLRMHAELVRRMRRQPTDVDLVAAAARQNRRILYISWASLAFDPECDIVAATIVVGVTPRQCYDRWFLVDYGRKVCGSRRRCCEKKKILIVEIYLNFDKVTTFLI